MLVAHHRKNLSTFSANIVVFPYNGKWNVQQHDIFVNTCLVSLGDGPFSVFNGHNLIVGKIVNINVCQSCEAGKDEYVLYQLQSFYLEVLLHNTENLFFCEISTVHQFIV